MQSKPASLYVPLTSTSCLRQQDALREWASQLVGAGHWEGWEAAYFCKTAAACGYGVVTIFPNPSACMFFHGGSNLGLKKYVNCGRGCGRFMDETGKIGAMLAEAAVEGARSKEDSCWFVMSRLYDVVNLLHRARPLEDGSAMLIPNSDIEAPRRHEHEFVESAQKYLEEHIDKRIGAGELARRLNTSVSTITHNYRALTGESPLRTLMSLRIKMAQSMLVKGETMKGIAAQTGFFDEFHFSKAFKKTVGMSPSAFLKSLR